MMLLHAGAALAPHDAATAWSFEPAVVLPLVIAAVMYARGSRIAMSLATRGGGRMRRENLLFLAGWSILALSLVSPLHAMGEVLFSAHMVQHELMMTVAAPLIVLGNPLAPMLWSLPRTWRRRAASLSEWEGVRAVWTMASNPIAAWMLHGLAIWVWHAPGLYDASVESEAYHSAQHATFLLTALLFWWSLLNRRMRAAGPGLAAVCLFTTAVHTSLLGALLTVAGNPLYSSYAGDAASAWGLSPVEDQQLGGIIMWVPGGLAYAAAALMLILASLKRSGERAVLLDGMRRAAAPVITLVALQLGGACARADDDAAANLAGGDPSRGREAMRKYGCQSCHSIPGVTGARSLVGPNLDGIASRAFIAGVLTNDPGNMILWLRDPPSVDEKTAMPNLSVTAKDARDMAAYLYTLR